MRIPTSKAIPSIQELTGILKDRLSHEYAFRLYGLGKDKSIIVEKNMLVGVQVSISDHDFILERIQPSATSSFIMNFFTFLFMGIAAPFIGLWELFFNSPWKKLQREIGLALRDEYAS